MLLTPFDHTFSPQNNRSSPALRPMEGPTEEPRGRQAPPGHRVWRPGDLRGDLRAAGDEVVAVAAEGETGGGVWGISGVGKSSKKH